MYRNTDLCDREGTIPGIFLFLRRNFGLVGNPNVEAGRHLVMNFSLCMIIVFPVQCFLLFLSLRSCCGGSVIFYNACVCFCLLFSRLGTILLLLLLRCVFQCRVFSNRNFTINILGSFYTLFLILSQRIHIGLVWYIQAF